MSEKMFRNLKSFKEEFEKEYGVKLDIELHIHEPEDNFRLSNRIANDFLTNIKGARKRFNSFSKDEPLVFLGIKSDMVELTSFLDKEKMQERYKERRGV